MPTIIRIVIMSAQIVAGGSNLSVCSLQHAEAFLSPRVAVTGVLAFTNHGIFLVSDPCGKDAEDVVILFPKTDDAPKVDFDLDPPVEQMLRPFVRPIGRSTYACATLSGQLFQKTDFRVRSVGAGPEGNGFGPRGAFRLALVIQSVTEIHVCNRPEAVK